MMTTLSCLLRSGGSSSLLPLWAKAASAACSQAVSPSYALGSYRALASEASSRGEDAVASASSQGLRDGFGQAHARHEAGHPAQHFRMDASCTPQLDSHQRSQSLSLVTSRQRIPTASCRHASTLPPCALQRRAWLLPAASLAPTYAWPSPLALPALHRGYKSNKRSMKPLNMAASWAVVRPLLLRKRALQAGPNAASTSSKPVHAAADGIVSATRPLPQPNLAPLVDSCIQPIPEVPVPPEWRCVARLDGRRYKLDLFPAFGVVQIAGAQFKLTVDDVFFVNRLHGTDVNDVLALDRVLMLGTATSTTIGRPYVVNATVLVAVEEHFRDGKVHVFKKKRRKRHTKYRGSRAELTTLRVLAVLGEAIAPLPNPRYHGLRPRALVAAPGPCLNEWAVLQQLALPVKPHPKGPKPATSLTGELEVASKLGGKGQQAQAGAGAAAAEVSTGLATSQQGQQVVL